MITFAFVTSDDKISFWRIAGPLRCRGARGSLPRPPLSTALITASVSFTQHTVLDVTCCHWHIPITL